MLADDAMGDAWRLVLEAQRWHAGLPSTLPSEASLTRALDTKDPAVRSVALLALGQSSKAALLRLDVDALERHALLARRFRAGLEPGEATFWCDVMESWLAIAAGDEEAASARTESLQEDAARYRLPTGVLEAASLRALAISSRDPGRAISAARRASRMARTEAFPQWEYLANAVLARLRRLTHRPHLSTRILGALARVVPSPWHGFIAWELRMAGGGKPPELALDVDPGDGLVDWARVAASSLGQIIEGAATDCAALDPHIETARAAVGRFAPFATDLESALAAIDPRSDLRSVGNTPTRQWCMGESLRPPPALCGLCTHLDADSPGQARAAWVYAPLSGAARRLAPRGEELVGPEVVRVTPQSGLPGRSETLVAALALAGPQGLPLRELFRTVYGFEYVASTHKNVFNVLLHRTRARLEGLAVIDREDDQLRLALHEPLLVPDPRCEQPLEDLVLRLLARRGAGDAKNAARALSIPLRTVQTALQQLTEEGAVLARRRGRGLEYRIEDTTFSEPTTHF